MPWTRSRIRELRAGALEAQGRIEELFVSAVVGVEGKGYGWSQFLDTSRDNPDYGIYGTSAGIQVLTAAGFPTDNEMVAGACEVLGDAFQEDNFFRQKGDLGVLPKLAYLAEADRPDEVILSAESQAMNEIVRHQLPRQGWGHHFSASDRDSVPRIVATTLALLALKRYRPYQSTDKCEDALKWLCRSVEQNGSMRGHELGLAALALIEYKNRIRDYPECASTFQICTDRLAQWAITDVDYGTLELYVYTTKRLGHRWKEYLYFLPHCVAALAFLRLDGPRLTRRYALQVVEFFCKALQDSRGFAPDTTGRAATVEHLWIYRLLQEFGQKPIDTLSPLPRLPWSEASMRARWLISFIFFVIGSVSFYTGHLTSNIALQIFGGILEVIFLGLFVTAIGKLLFNGDDE